MRHPNAYPDTRNPREVRSYMHTIYDRYIHAQDMFPKIRMIATPDKFSIKSRGIATSLAEAWALIDNDNSFFDESLEAAVNMGMREKDPIKKATIITKVGINAVNFAQINPDEQAPSGLRVELGQLWKEPFVEMLSRTPLKMTDGRVVRFVDGSLAEKSAPDAAILRKSGAASVFFAQAPPEAA